MRNIDERLIRMHQRASEIKRQEDMSRLRVLGSLSGGLLVCLVVVLQQLQNLHHGVMIDQSTGSSLLDDSVGGYVLAAIISFASAPINIIYIPAYSHTPIISKTAKLPYILYPLNVDRYIENSLVNSIHIRLDAAAPMICVRGLIFFAGRTQKKNINITKSTNHMMMFFISRRFVICSGISTCALTIMVIVFPNTEITSMSIIASIRRSVHTTLLVLT